MSQKWEKINQNFAWLKVASINISHSTVLIASPFSWCHFYLLLNEFKVSLNRNGLLLKKVTFKILNGYSSKLQGDMNFNFDQGESEVNLHKAISSPPNMSPASLPFFSKTQRMVTILTNQIAQNRHI